jgi:hypothetical protein
MRILRNASHVFIIENIAYCCGIVVECNYTHSSPHYVLSLDALSTIASISIETITSGS